MLKKDTLIDAVLSGILNANDFYEKISNGLSINDSGVEGVLQTKIAEAIFDVLPKDEDGFLKEESMVLEVPFKDIFDQSGAGKTRGRVPQLVSGAKRIDIVVFDKNENPIIPIEIKGNAATEGFATDANRILGVLKRSDILAGGSVRFGLICGFIFGIGESEAECLSDREEKRIKCRGNLDEKTNIERADFCHRYDNAVEFDDYGWWCGGAICVYLRRS